MNYTLRRLLQAIPTLVAVTILAFLLIHLVPGDPIVAIAGEGATETQIQQLRQQYGLDQPLPSQYLIYIASVAHGDFGRSIQSRQPVAAEIGRRFPATALLAVCAMVLATLVGVAAGVVSAYFNHTWIDTSVTVMSLTGVCMPAFWLGLLGIMVFSVYLGVLPSIGLDSPQSLVLPALTLAAGPVGIITRLSRGAMLEVLREDYVRTARSKGLGERSVVVRHMLRNAFIPTLTMLGLQFGVLLSGALVTESVFAWPGLGRLTVDALLNRDYPVLQGLILLFATIFILINLIVDLLYGAIDPRIRLRA